MMHRKTQVAAAVGAAMLIGASAAQAQTAATPVSAAQSGLTVQLYGQMHRALMFADDGHQSKWFHVDGQPSSTRIGINASGQIAPGLRAGGRIETEMKSNPSNAVNFADPSTGAGPGNSATVANVAYVERWLEAYVEGAFGRLSIGQGSGAADDVSTIDLSGTALANGTCPSDWGGGFNFRTTAGGVGPLLGGSPTSVSGDCNDFESRYDRVVYTTPTFGGLRAQVGQGQRTDAGEATEASLWYAGKMGGLGEISAAIGWSNVNLSTPTTPDRETIGGSISWLHGSGFNVTAAHTRVDGVSGTSVGVGADRTGKHTWLKVGYKFGTHAIAFDYGMYDDMNAAGDEAKSYGIGYVWNPIRWAELYAGYHMWTLDRAGVDYEDPKFFALGTRIRF
jgi:predicted porin